MSSHEEKNKNSMLLRIAGVCGVLGSVLPLVMTLSATFLSSWFRWDENALSDLGVGEQALLFNSAVILGGLLSFFFAVGLYRYVGNAKLVKSGAFSIIGSSVSLALVGVFTINYLTIHAIVALGYFLLAPIGFLLIGSGTKENNVRKVSITCGIAALLAILLLPVIILVLPFGIGFAVPELIEALAILVWTVFMSAKLIGQSKLAGDARYA